MIVAAAVLTPVAVQAQEQGRERGNWQRGSGESSGNGRWQRGGGNDGAARAAGVDNDARRRGWEQRGSATTVERAQDNRAIGTLEQRREDRGAAGRVSNGDEMRRRWIDARTGGPRSVETGAIPGDGRIRDRSLDRARTDDRATVGINDRRDRDWRDRDSNRDGRNDRRDWDRERRGDRDWNRSWTTDRRDWDRDGRHDRWDRDWRNDRRYAWQDHRVRNRQIYRLPRYVAPRAGFSYRRWYPGYRFDSFFYSRNYWISDPWFYRLPPAYGDYRWVRYYDDAVLVDIYTGEIVDIIYSFFF